MIFCIHILTIVALLGMGEMVNPRSYWSAFVSVACVIFANVSIVVQFEKPGGMEPEDYADAIVVFLFFVVLATMIIRLIVEDESRKGAWRLLPPRRIFVVLLTLEAVALASSFVAKV